MRHGKQIFIQSLDRIVWLGGRRFVLEKVITVLPEEDVIGTIVINRVSRLKFLAASKIWEGRIPGLMVAMMVGLMSTLHEPSHIRVLARELLHDCPELGCARAHLHRARDVHDFDSTLSRRGWWPPLALISLHLHLTIADPEHVHVITRKSPGNLITTASGSFRLVGSIRKQCTHTYINISPPTPQSYLPFLCLLILVYRGERCFIEGEGEKILLELKGGEVTSEKEGVGRKRIGKKKKKRSKERWERDVYDMGRGRKQEMGEVTSMEDSVELEILGGPVIFTPQIFLKKSSNKLIPLKG